MRFARLRRLFAGETHAAAGVAAATWGAGGAAAGGTRGALAGAAAGALTEYVTDPIVRRIQERRAHDLHDALGVAGVTRERFVEALERDESIWDLYETAMMAGIHTSSERKRRALGQALARGVLSDAGWPREHDLRVIQGIAAIEPSDLLVLDYMANMPAHDVTAPGAKQFTHLEAMSVEEGELQASFDHALLDIVLENLTSRGLVWSPGLHIATAVFTYKPTALGRAVWRAFKEAADD